MAVKILMVGKITVHALHLTVKGITSPIGRRMLIGIEEQVTPLA